MQDIKSYAKDHLEELRTLLKELCFIPAPSHLEDKRAEYCKNWFVNNGAIGVYIDEAKNVVFPINCERSNRITVVEAHTDTVFPDTEPMSYCERDGKIYSPGVGDDTVCLATLMIVAKYFIENNIKPENGVLFVCNSCEEGLGNLKGTRQIFKAFEGRISKFLSFDTQIESIYTDCVGSVRYEVTVETEGGHSFARFGNTNAISELSKIVNEIYKIEVPKCEGSKTTYNVGKITGGTSVNTIAQNASLLCEYRSDKAEHLAIMKNKFEKIFENAKSDKVKVTVNIVGERPCSEIAPKLQSDFSDLCSGLIEKTVGIKPLRKSASTDCNIPLSLGIPALCVGTYRGDGAHTRGEWISCDSILTGLELALGVTVGIVEP